MARLDIGEPKKLHGRETIRRMTETILRTMQTERQLGKHNMRDDEMRRVAQQRAERLVADVIAQHMIRPLR